MKKNGLLLSAIILAGCANVSNHEISAHSTQNTAVIHVNNTNAVLGVVGCLIQKPDNRIKLTSIDGRGSRGYSDTTYVAPGVHTLTFDCSFNGNNFGQFKTSIKMLPGRTYTVSYPSYMNGYSIDYTACSKLIFEQI